MTELLTALIVSILGALGTWITPALIPYIKGKTTQAQQESINYWISAAEQIFTGSGRGAEKLEYVEQFLAGRGIGLYSAESRTLIESAVFWLKDGLLWEG